MYYGSILLLTAGALFSCAKEDKGLTIRQQLAPSLAVQPDTLVKFGASQIGLVTDILNLPSVIKFSRVEAVRKQYGRIYGRVYGFNLEQDSVEIQQQSNKVFFVQALDSVSAGKVPCYVFNKIIILKDTAEVQLTFPMTGFLAFGKMYFKNGHWHPTKEFRAGRI